MLFPETVHGPQHPSMNCTDTLMNTFVITYGIYCAKIFKDLSISVNFAV